MKSNSHSTIAGNSIWDLENSNHLEVFDAAATFPVANFFKCIHSNCEKYLFIDLKMNLFNS